MKSNEQIENTLAEFHLPTYYEIPDVGLYLEQVAKFINSYFNDFPEMQVTPSMISNYAKLKLFDRINKKTYTRDQISTLLFINCAKTVLSIDHIRTALQEIRDSKNNIEELYQYCSQQLTALLTSFYHHRIDQKKEDVIDIDSLRMLNNIITAVAHKMFLEKYFSMRKKKK